MTSVAHQRGTSPVRGRRLRRPLTMIAMAAGLVGTGGAIAPAAASSAVPAAVVNVESCTAVPATVHYVPGLRPASRNQTVTLTGTLSGCTGQFGNQQPGQGLITLNLAGASSTGTVSARGTFTINWPAAAGLNPSTGTATLSGPGMTNTLRFSGTVTGGAFPAAPVGVTWVISGRTGNGTNRRPITAESLANTVPLTATRNLG